MADIHIERLDGAEEEMACKIQDTSLSRKKDAVVEILDLFPWIDKTSEKQSLRKALTALVPDRMTR